MSPTGDQHPGTPAHPERLALHRHVLRYNFH